MNNAEKRKAWEMEEIIVYPPLYIPLQVSYLFGPPCPLCSNTTVSDDGAKRFPSAYHCFQCKYSANHNKNPLYPTHYIQGQEISNDELEKYKLLT